ncbi:putative skeletal organic matrix protein 1 [Acropora cervicornis]|uniref:Skeletal organic matrix protein 1 n=1 Tax=Acropora cervicornis TaxID=6130 RepID=A0AAD9R6G9_ACRCE|nr:putative skeletal organic matrix protein 1 [Acropora cervicornis]
MEDKKDLEKKVDLPDSKLKEPTRTTRLLFVGALTLFLLLGVVVSFALFLTLKETAAAPSKDRLVDVNLREGDSLTYQVDQDIETNTGAFTHKEKNVIIVGIQVLNKSSEDLPGESLEVYGENSTDDQQLRLMFSVLQLLLPAVKRDLYENIDGNRNATVSAEDSPLLPANVMMHREANTSGKDAVSIKNHFNGADMVGMLSDLDMEFTYSDQSSIKKSNGMVSEGHAYFSQQLNFETPIRTENGTEISMIKMTVKSRVLLIGTVALIYPSPESIDFEGLFVKLFLSKPSPPVLSLNETTDAGQFSLNDTNEDPFAPLSRSRRAVSNSDNANVSLVSEILKRIGPVCLFFDRQFQLYSLNVNSVNLTLSASVSVQIDGANTSRIDVSLVLSVGKNLTWFVIQKFVFMVSLQELSDVNLNLPPIFRRLRGSTSFLESNTEVSGRLVVFPGFRLSLPLQSNSVDPPRLNLKIEPYAVIVVRRLTVTMSVNGIQQTVRARPVVKGSGPKVTLSFNDDQLCVTVSNRVIGPDVPVTFFRRLRVCLPPIRRVRRLWVRIRGLWRRILRIFLRQRCRWVIIGRGRGRLSPTVTQEGPVRVCNATKAANSSILLPTPTSQIAQSISTAQMVSSSGASILVTSVLASQSSPLRISPASVSSTSASIFATPVLALQSSSLRISPASTAPTSATVSSPVASMS